MPAIVVTRRSNHMVTKVELVTEDGQAIPLPTRSVVKRTSANEATTVMLEVLILGPHDPGDLGSRRMDYLEVIDDSNG